MHILVSDECELGEHENCPGTVFCEECVPAPVRPCSCTCGLHGNVTDLTSITASESVMGCHCAPPNPRVVAGHAVDAVQAFEKSPVVPGSSSAAFPTSNTPSGRLGLEIDKGSSQ